MNELIDLIHRHLSSTTGKPLGQMGVYHCHQHQKLHTVPVYHPSIILVLRGEKRVAFSSRDERLNEGFMALIPADSEIYVENTPCTDHKEYLAVCLSFPPDTINRFVATYGSNIDWDEQKSILTAFAPRELVQVVEQRVNWCMQDEAENWVLNDLQQQQLLSICSQHKLLGLLLQSRHPSCSQRVSSIVSMDLAYKWKISDVCSRLAMSESSLRRHLQEENTGFSDILEKSRLAAALSLLQETSLTVQEVAAMVGYQSPSRFTDRFKLRFGITPKELKWTRIPQQTSQRMAE